MIASLVITVCAPIVGLPVASFRRDLCGLLVALAHSPRSFSRGLVATPLQSLPLLSRPKINSIIAACGSDLTESC